MAKTNWQPGDAFTHTDANQLGEEVNLKPNATMFDDFWQGTEAAYNAISNKNPRTLYLFT